MIAVIGASGRSGAALCRALLAANLPFRPVVRNATRWAATGIPGAPAIADLADPTALGRALDGAQTVVSCAHARHAAAILAAAPAAARFVLLGSTRRFTRWPDAHGRGVIAGERALLDAGRAGLMLHPTMIYGAEGEDNVQRLARLIRRLPMLPLPGGGRALVQPIHQSDVTRCLLAAIRQEGPGASAIVIAGPTPLPYRDFVAAVARAAGQRCPRVLTVPAAALRLAAPLTLLLPGLPRVRADEVRRLLEDKAFPVDAMRVRLGVDPIPLEEGLRLTFAAAAPVAGAPG